MSIFGLFHKPKAALRVVIDVGSHSIRALVFEAPDSGGLPKILKKKVVKLPVAPHAIRVAAGLHELVFLIVKELGRIPDQITVSFGPNLAEHSIKIWSVERHADKKTISRSDLRTYFQNLFEQNRDRTSAVIAYPLQLFANGYPVFDIEADFHGVKRLDFRTLLLCFPNEAGVAFGDLRRSFGGMPIEFVSSAVAHKELVFRSFRIPDAFLVDVGGEYTGLALLREGELVGISYFPLGGRHFLAEISRITSSTVGEAQDIMRQYAQGLLSNALKVQIGELLRQTSELWKKELLKELDSFYHLGPLPSEIFLFGGGANLPEIGAALRSKDWFGNFSYADSQNVRLLSAESVFGGNTFGGFLQGSEEAGLASLIIYSLYHEHIF